MTSAFTDHPSAQRRLKSGCSGSLRGFIVDSVQCEATICSFASSLGDCRCDAPTAAGNHQDGFSTDVSIHARDLLFGVMPGLRSRVEPLRVRQHGVDRSTRPSPGCEASGAQSQNRAVRRQDPSRVHPPPQSTGTQPPGPRPNRGSWRLAESRIRRSLTPVATVTCFA